MFNTKIYGTSQDVQMQVAKNVKSSQYVIKLKMSGLFNKWLRSNNYKYQIREQKYTSKHANMCK